jgi:REP-associated tyrosine transposase
VPDYRRYFVPGGTFFFTVVTAERHHLFANAWARHFLGQVMRETRDESPFETVAIVLLPDHLHAIRALPRDDDRYSARWRGIKANFTSKWLEFGGEEMEVTVGYRAQRRRGVWQARFIEHTIRDEGDLSNHADYLHYNPVKHQLARCPKDWPWSSFHRFVQLGHYPADWGCADRHPPVFGNVDAELLE